jgi:hypothetical protein
MKTRLAAVALLLLSGGCLNRQVGSDGIYRVQGMANAFSLYCSQQTVLRLGYQITWLGAGDGLRAERRLDDSGPEVSRGYLTVTLANEGYGEVLEVAAERIQQTSRLPIPGNPAPRPQPQPVPVPTVRRSGPRRVAPGPVADDARSVARRCSTGNVASVAD